MRPTLLLGAMMLASTAAPGRSLEDLERTLARTPPVSIAFAEYRFSHLLKQPLGARGTLEYRADGVLARRVDSPRREVSEVHGDTLRILRDDKPPRSLPLERAPQLRALLRSFRALLDGRLTPLQEDFDLVLEAQAARWTLTLRPREPRLAKLLARIEIFGEGDLPTCLQMLEPDGDGSITLFGAAPAHASEAGGLPAREDLERSCRGSATVPPASLQ